MRNSANPSLRSFWISLGIAALLVAGLVVCWRPILVPNDPVLLAAAIAYTHENYAEAERLALQHATAAPHSPRAWLIAGEAAAKLHANDRALAHFGHVPDDGGPESIRALYGSATRQLRLGRARHAERLLRRVLECDPHHIGAATDLTYLLGVEGRNWETLPLIDVLIRHGRMSGDHLRLACSTETTSLGESLFVTRCLEAVPDDPLPLLGEAGRSLRINDRRQAEELLRRIVEHHPTNSEAQAKLGRIFVDQEDDSAFVAWEQSLPDGINPHPDLWVNRGLWARRQQQDKAAARCFWEAIRLHPHHGIATYQLSQTLEALNLSDEAQLFGARARQLAQIDYLLLDIGDDLESFRLLAEALQGIGRHWEAAGWYEAAWQTRSRPLWAGPALTELARKLPYQSSLLSPEETPDKWVDLSDYPLPDFQRRVTETEASGEPTEQFGTPQFANIASEKGLRFEYFNGANPQSGRAYMFEFQGGGVAVLDYDNDGWPDIYLTQGCHWPPQAEDYRHQDRLFRNLQGQGFVDVTEQAQLGDNGLSGGVAVGDFNNDGFHDLYVCNIGPNRLYQNNGDGTFSDVTDISQTAGDHWSSGAAFGDFNQDGLPDLYVVNYLAGPDVYRRACFDEDRPVQCGPTLFSAEQDRLYLNLGDGRFQDVTEASGIVAKDGKGLGLVVADFDGAGRLGVFVANDTTANFLFRNVATTPEQKPIFAEQAMQSGVAFDENGQAQACMGIAAGDLNEDGRIDLFVTNFYRQSNAMYVQEAAGTFRDWAKRTGIFDISFPMLGWGAQFLDAERDGQPDLVLVNGHVNDFRTGNTPYHMRAQFLRRANQRKFVEAPAEAGSYFSELHLGRALARLDWNRDGKEDFCATHIDAPVALLENRTSPAGNYLAVKLVGVQCARDAIGARVRLEAGGKVWHRQLTSGDGFQASNERVIVFGIGNANHVDALSVQWPGDPSEVVYRNVPLNAEILLIEGWDHPFPRAMEQPKRP